MSKLPSVTSNIPRDLRNFIDRVREAFNATGNDRIITVRDLVRGGIASSGPGGSVVPVDDTAVYGTPPAPANLAASGALANIILTWDRPKYAGHMHAEVWSSATNDITTSVKIGVSPSAVYVDNVGAAATKYYWIRYVNVLDQFGPYNSAAGTLGQTGTDPAYLLDVLTGSITSSELSTALNTAITDNTTEITNINNLYMVKMSNAGSLSGFGLMSTLSEGGDPTSDFFVNVDRFAITTPMATSGATTGLPLRANSTAYVQNSSVRISGVVTKVLICKVAGTSGGTAPSIAGAIGSLVTDGTVTWQIASSVPLAVLTKSLTANGTTLAPGVYIDGATIVNATINSAQIGSLTADKITTGTLGAGVIYAGTVEAADINATTLSAITANTGALSVSGALTMGTTGHIKGGQTAYDTGTGFFLGYDSTAYKFSIGNSAGTKMTWNGTALTVTGGTITGGTIQTATTGARVVLSAATNKLIVYNAAGDSTITVGGDTSGLIYVTSTVTLPAVYATATGADAIYGSGTTIGGVRGSATSGTGVTGSSSTSGIGVYGVATNSSVSTTNHGVRGRNNRNSASGLIGEASGYDFYAEGSGTNYGPFTGTHDALTLIADTFTVGDIVTDTAVIRRNGISSTITLVANSSMANQKAVLGVVCAAPKPLTNSQPAVYIIGFSEETRQNIMSPDYDTDCLSYNTIAINALGEGQINVCGEGGDIAAGDLIVTSSIAGKGMRQADDIVRSYTVAKAREAVTFSSPTEQKQIACIYLCG